MKKYFQISCNEFFYQKLWKNDSLNMKKKIVYILIPWGLLAILYFILYFKNALIMEGAYGFLNDFSNLFALSYVFVFIYYVSGYYSEYICDKMNVYKNKIDSEKLSIIEKSGTRVVWINFISLAMSCFGIWFIYIASLNGENNWYEKLQPYYLWYYCLLIALSWYMSSNVLLKTMLVSVQFYKILNSDIKLNINNSDMSCGLKGFFNVLSVNIGIAFYFALWIAIIIISDFRAINYGVDNAFHKYPILLVPIALIVVFYLAVVLLPFLKAKNKINELVNEELEKCRYPDKRIEELIRIKHSMYSSKNIILPILTNAIPIITAVISKVL